MKLSKIFAILALAVLVITGCDNDKNTVARMTMVSTSSLNFDVAGGIQTITVYADADWVLDDCPDWLLVTPSEGTAVVDVDIMCEDNYLNGEPNIPRSYTLLFKGRNKRSESTIYVSQDGDKYRDVQEYTIPQIAGLDNGTALSVPSAIVVLATTEGYLVADANNMETVVYVVSDEIFLVGDEISMLGDKTTTNDLPVINLDTYERLSTDNAVTYPTPTDITSEVSTYKSTSWDYVSVKGVLVGDVITVEDSSYSVNVVETPTSFGLSDYTGHRVLLTGYYAGTVAPYVRIIANEVEDLGSVITYFFYEDFEWLEPWSEVGGSSGSAGDQVGNRSSTDYAPQIGTPKIDGVSARDALIEKGYTFLRTTPNGDVDASDECIYLQWNYLKFGKTGYQAGIILPPLEEAIPEGHALTLAFDWSPMITSGGNIDSVNLIVDITGENGSFTYDILTQDFIGWTTVELDVSSVVFSTRSTIQFWQQEWGVSTAHRWFIDNISLYTTDEL